MTVIMILLLLPYCYNHYRLRFYPYHYAPFVSDVQESSFTQLTLDRGEPFLPLEHLMAVLPQLSEKKLLPEAYSVSQILQLTHKRSYSQNFLPAS